MGLDFTISELTEEKIDEQGRIIQTNVELDNFYHDGYKMMDYGLGNQENCTTVAYDTRQFIQCLDDMRKALDEINSTGIDKYNEKTDLESAIDTLHCFIEQENLTEDSDRIFDIHVWY